jgi:predicted TIM-barrel fold metal-dependent hydrolase
MDEYGLHAHVLYPNVGGFGAGRFLQLGDPELMRECVRAYNDFVLEFSSEAPGRLIPLTATAFWDVDWTVKEVERCAKAGHKGIIFTHLPESFGQPVLGDPHWAPLWETAQDLGLSINFHIGNGNMTGSRNNYAGNGRQINYAKYTSTLFMDNALGVMEVIGSGLCHRYPKLNFVSVESGIGWIPFVLESLGWQWDNSGVHQEHPEYDLTPTEYFKRQVYGCFWFEKDSALGAIDILGADNFLFETDFPHPTSISPGPNSRALNPIDHIEERLGGLPEETLRKVLHNNAARIYHLD